jgi:hypothetical protein
VLLRGLSGFGTGTGRGAGVLALHRFRSTRVRRTVKYTDGRSRVPCVLLSLPHPLHVACRCLAHERRPGASPRRRRRRGMIAAPVAEAVVPFPCLIGGAAR